MYTHLVELVCFDACLHCITCTVVANYSLVELRIPLGDRPPWEEIDQKKAEGLKKLVDLMKRCWTEEPLSRPTAQSKCHCNRYACYHCIGTFTALIYT